ncbi:uncharacterized protein BX663DRAFT_424433 [Cokeromyces recurvatus]|uniref:uncharacterized protein n=1 Tax=Cokeromyces recurvatus TaxID=90255 RepID=UPI002220554D|nr:uncharacterized protein BX663DRAFT_424433 [Cokeromyces recurvatus]KAI7908227.1 hypothetical protein BX663DRAFT_424433 [Cokeromyces recurvatus]
MSLFEKALANVIAQATNEYQVIAKNDPKVESTEDGTSRGEFLDLILKAQQKERKLLWDKLYKLESKQNQQKNKLFGDTAEPTMEHRQLKTLMYEHQDLFDAVAEEANKIEDVEQTDNSILEIEFREQLNIEIQQYEIANRFIQTQLDEVTELLKSEKRVLNECFEIYDALKAKKRELSEEQHVQAYPDQLRQEQLMLEALYKQDTNDLIDFIDEHYPPHPVDNAGELGDECDLKTMLEQLMNQAIITSDNPYIKLQPGEYWSPYIQTLLKADILKYHPEDSTLVRLQDFKL